LNTFLASVPVVALASPKNCKQKLSRCWTRFEIFLGGQMRMFPFHTLAFTLWLIMVDPSSSMTIFFQEMVTFSSTAIQKLFADVATFLFVQFCELLWDPTCADFMAGKPDVDNIIG